MYGRVLEDAMRHTTSGTVSVLEYLTEYAKDSISLVENRGSTQSEIFDNPFPKNLGRDSQVSLICEHYMIPMRKKVNHTLRWWWHLKRSNFDLFKWFEKFIHASLI